jgi:uncharacterized protein YebE (UPF0316 family)
MIVADFPGFAYLSSLPLLIFVAELCVVTISTIRIIFVARGMMILAPVLGFFEVATWLFAIGQIMQNLNDVGCYIAFAAGFSLGNYLGVLLEKKLAIGSVVVHITTKKDVGDLVESLRAAEYGVTTLGARGATGPVQVVFTVIKRRELDNVVAIIKSFDANAFYSINELQTASSGIFPAARRRNRGIVPSPIRLSRSAA